MSESLTCVGWPVPFGTILGHDCGLSAAWPSCACPAIASLSPSWPKLNALTTKMSTNKSRMLKSLASRSADAQSAPRAPRRAGPPSTSATASSSRPASRPRPPTQPKPTPIPLRRHTPYVVYEDEKQLVLNKPAGVAIQGEHWTSARMMWDNLLEGECPVGWVR